VDEDVRVVIEWIIHRLSGRALIGLKGLRLDSSHRLLLRRQ